MSEARPRIIITRAAPGAAQTAERLSAIGASVIISPALELCARNEPVPDLDVIGGLVFTSANGVRFFSEACDRRDLPAWCVGPATASQALREWFSPVHQSSGDAHDLAHYIAHHWSGGDKALLHVANAAAGSNLRTALEAEGFSITFLPLYEACPAATLSNEASDALKNSARTIVLGHSRKGVEAFLTLTRNMDLSHTEFVVISEQAAAPLETIGATRVHIATHPDDDHLISALERVLGRA